MHIPRDTAVKRTRSVRDSKEEPWEEGEETAASYGRKEQCTWDHRRAPYRFEACVFNVSASHESRDAQGLIDQDGLPPARLPAAEFDFRISSPECIHEPDWGFDTRAGDSSPRPFAFRPVTSLLKDYGLPLELVNLGSDPIEDVKEYLILIDSRNSCQLIDQWLPLCPTRRRKDEVLSFPEKSGQLHSLLLQELDNEQIELSEMSEVLADEVTDCKLSPFKEGMSSLHFPPMNLEGRELLPVSPPLSPMSEENTYFVPREGMCIIDLTSDPESPENDMTFESVVQQMPDSKPSTPVGYEDCSAIEASRITLELDIQTKQDHRLDVPLLSSASSVGTAENVLQSDVLELHLDNGNENLVDEPNGGVFEDAFRDKIEACYSKSMLLVEQESFNPHESLARVPVPRLDFAIPPGEYTGFSKSNVLFREMSAKSEASYFIPIDECSSELASALKWAPMRIKDRFSGGEELQPLTDRSKELVAFSPSPSKRGVEYIAKERNLAILNLEEEELDDASASEAPDSAHSPAVSSIETLGRARKETSLDCPKPDEFSSFGHLLRLSKGSRQDLFLPLSSDEGATAKLLSSFMELRAAEKISKAAGSTDEHDTDRNSVMRKGGEHQPASFVPGSKSKGYSMPPLKLIPVEVPAFSNPDRHGAFIISIDFDHRILRHLEKYWPPECLLDRDFSLYNMHDWSDTGETHRETSSSALSSECDIVLTPSVGIIITSFVKAKQTQLPGSRKLPDLQARVLAASERYETIFVLVSEESVTGEVIGTLSPSDVAAYADFVSFTLSLDATVIAHYIPGASDTVAKWIAAFMSHYTSNALQFERFLTGEETTWGKFLRHAGMTVLGSRVLSGMLFEGAKNRGLATFLSMAVEDRISRYAGILGGKKQLLGVSRVLDEDWG